VPSAFSSFAGAPYVVQAIHDNRVNQQSYVVNNPGFFNANLPATQNQIVASPSAVPSYHTIDSRPHRTRSLLHLQRCRRITPSIQDSARR